MEQKPYYEVNRISSSSLKWFKESPLFFRKMMDKEIELEEQRWQELGRQLHMYILEEQEFYKHYAFFEFDVPKSQQQRLFCDDYINAKSKGKSDEEAAIEAYKKNYVSSGKEEKIKEKALALSNQLNSYIEYLERTKTYKAILNRSTWEYLKEAKKAIMSHKIASRLLTDTEEDKAREGYFSANEFPIYWTATKYNLECKSLLDRLVIDRDKKTIFLIDIKTTSSYMKFKEKILDFGYAEQMAFYWMAIYWYFTENFPSEVEALSSYTMKTFIIAVSTNDAVECRVYEIQESTISEALNTVEGLLDELSYHVHNNVWEHEAEYYEGDGINKV